MAAENKSSFASPVRSAEDVQRICFSDAGKTRYQAEYPSLSPGEIDDALNQIQPLMEKATIFTFIPTLVDGNLRRAKMKKNRDTT